MNPTVLIGLDGATFTILDHLVENGTMPFLAQFIKTGARANLLSTANPLTPPAWVSLMTGRSPGEHGVIDFIWSEERKSDHYFTLYNYRDIHCETIWELVSRQGGRISSLNFPMMSPPPAVSGAIVPGLVSWKHLKMNVYPPELYDRMKALPGFSPKDLAWDFDLEKKAERGVPVEEYEKWITFHIRREKQWFVILRDLMQKTPSDLTAMLFDGTDKISHMGWRFLDPAFYPKNPTPFEQKIRNLCLDFFKELDGFIADICRMAGPQAHVFMASDHGFGPSTFVFRVNTWLHEQGYLTWKSMEGLDEKERQSAEKLADRHFVYLDWDKTTAYARTTTSNGIYIRVAREPGQTGVPPEQYEAFRDALKAKLLALKNPADGTPVVKRVLTREEAYPGSNNRQAPDLTLVMSDYSFVSILNRQPVVCQRPEVEGTHYPEGIFMAHGPGIRPGTKLPLLSILDIAPCLVYSLGLDVPADFEGRVPDGLFTEAWMQQHPCKTGEKTKIPDSYAVSAEQRALKGEDKEQVCRLLQALGYME